MEINELLASWSNLLIVSAMAVYAISFIAFAFDLFRDHQSPGKTSKLIRTRRSSHATSRRIKASSPIGQSTTVIDQTGDSQATNSARAVKGRRTNARIGIALTVIALLLHGSAVLTRSLAVMRPPWGNMMEYVLTATAIVIAAYLIILLKTDLRYLGTFVTGGVLLWLGAAITIFYTPAAQLMPALQSYWIFLHVPIAIFSTALLSISAILTLFQIAKVLAERRNPRWLGFMAQLPASSDIERTSYLLAAVGFITWTFTVIAGAIWAQVAWGNFWGWDTKEIWSFVVWVIYASYLHARATRGWGPTKVAALNLVGASTVIFNFAVVNVYFNGLHSYSGLS